MFIVESTEDPTYRAVYMLLSQLKVYATIMMDEVDAKIVVAGISTTCSQKIHNQLTHDSHLCPILFLPPSPFSRLHLTPTTISTPSPSSLSFSSNNLTGKRNSWKIVLCGQSLIFKSEPKLASNSMESEKEFPELKRNLYPDIEPDSSGFLKVLDIHTIYWEQSGNPDGHVSCNSSS
ncbi:hypothetical protein ACFX1X_027296 [Malus domestica]